MPTFRSGWDHVYRAPNQSSANEQDMLTPSLVPASETTILPVQNTQISSQNQENTNLQQTTISYQYATFQSSLQLLFNEIDLLQTAGEITEVEAADLKELAVQGDNRVKEAIRLHTL